MPGQSRSQDSFGPNAWLVDDMYEQYRRDPSSVSASWQEFFEGYRPGGANLARVTPEGSDPSNGLTAPATQPGWGGPAPSTKARTEGTEPQGNQGNDVAGRSPDGRANGEAAAGGGLRTEGDVLFNGGAPTLTKRAAPPVGTPIRGAAARVVANMSASLEVPTATSFRVVPARLLEVNRRILNNQLSRSGSAGKVSFTHLIGYAVVEALRSVPVLNSTFVAADAGQPKAPATVVHHDHLGLGIAVDSQKSDGSRTLMVPVIKEADTLSFRGFWAAYEDLIRKVRTAKIGADDFAGATVSLTNPGTIGTVQSVPRLMPGQGAIIGVGTIDYPAEWQAADPRVLAELGVSKVVTITSTYDHRIIQGAESGLFLQKVHQLLTGGDGFYETIFRDMGVPYEAVAFHSDVNDPASPSSHLEKQIEVDKLINIYRVRGHLIAHLDPLDWKPAHMHAELDPATYGLTVWDLEREFVAHQLGNTDRMRLSEILGLLRDAYCRTVGVEYMHISEPAQKRWIQEQVEGVSTQLEPEEHRWILGRLNAAEALEQFLNTKYIGQKRFGLEGGEAAIPLVDAMLDAAATAGQEQAVIGMAHRGRLNVLINIVGKTYRDLFSEFEGNIDPGTVQGSGDVKYHKGFRGTFSGHSEKPIDVVLSSNPSHLEAVDPVVAGMARARQDQLDGRGSAKVRPVLPLLIHGDAAFAGQGVVAETLNMSALPGYETGGSIHLVINNQLGFTTNPESARSSIYASDVAKIVQAPIFHVNGDDPEACVRVGRLAFAFRQTFHKDVVIDMVCYRRFGHNEQDDPSLTQPLLYQLIKEHRSVRKLYTEALVRRGDITLDEAEEVLKDFSTRLQAALDQTRASAPPKATQLPPPPEPAPVLPPIETGVKPAVLAQVVDRLSTYPEGFTVHPKLVKVFDNRAKLWADGRADWALGEALAYGTLLLEGHDVRVSGQDTRRGTFGHRNAALVDYRTGQEWVPLEHLAGAAAGASGATRPPEGLGRFSIYDSLLSEYAALGFEYGYSLVQRDALVAWEAQFGDFVNGAQIIIDQFLAAAEIKWAQTSGLVLLLPHGFEGQGAEHSSARMERFLDLCAEDNIQVADVTTAAQLFHLLRRQVQRTSRKPLVLFTPKRYLRAKESYSPAEEFASGHFREVLDDAAVGGSGQVRRVVLATGKVAIDATVARDTAERTDVAIVRVEQLHPWPEDQIAVALAGYEHATDVIWLQEEPENMGAWGFVRDRLARLTGDDFRFQRVSRVASGSPATGSHAMHDLEQADLLQRALG
ncbi:MAG: multifunctional oxoglutarate decarboxylase/oxoglutarate dehydrogenase thiamine pyrophosphate-binding subunit/dihydrolipoyllysine-residue succinyltransferase subunit [Actinomycetota bacterium]|nr:multifunctional oxoglutarate decarboxylase/oxoglutarate dehydrogenase thiamine pyrophosphate-binding subunit/dihydrolipoyllysine-residue succinyltransferase subunit [Actinomycetota bacterium]